MRSLAMFGCLVLLTVVGCGAEPVKATNAEPMAVMVSAEQVPGLDDFMQHCASCHGKTGRGDSTFAEIFAIPIPDLTRLAVREGGDFPADYVRWVIDGRKDVAAHGPRDMPVWGYVFQGGGPDIDKSIGPPQDANNRIEGLVDYVASLQRVEEKT